MKFKEFLLNESEKVQPKNKNELKKIIEETIKEQGPRCDLNFIDTSLITDMSELFKDSIFNGDISKWNVSKVRNMSGMFYDAKSFNQPIGDWDVSNVKDMSDMFYGAESFNKPIGDWDVSNVRDMYGMFFWAESFNQPIENWNVSKVKNMRAMFKNSGLSRRYKEPNWYKE